MSINTQALVLKLLLSSSESDLVLWFDAAKSEYFSDSYRRIRKLISGFYEKHNRLPNITELKVANNRASTILSTLSALERTDIPEEVDLSIAVEALTNEYAQQLSLKTIQDKLLKDIVILDAQEITERLSEIQTFVSDHLDTSDKVFTGKQLSIFQTEEESLLETIMTKTSVRWDLDYGALRRQDLLLLGGKRGSGKSVMSMNFATNQFREGYICPYFTIEMRAGETFQRFLANIASVDAMGIRNKNLDSNSLERLALARAGMFEGGIEEATKFLVDTTTPTKMHEVYSLEKSLCKLPEVTPVVIVDDSELRLSSIDAHLSNLVAKYGNNITMCVVDYVNQVIVENQANMYDWKDQLIVAKGLKNLARKHNLAMISPYQINNDGEARLSQAILDPADYAMIIHAYENVDIICLEATKVRSISNVTFIIPMDWETLTLQNADVTKTMLADLIKIEEPAPIED